jgi:hypothetical protein
MPLTNAFSEFITNQPPSWSMTSPTASRRRWRWDLQMDQKRKRRLLEFVQEVLIGRA